MNNTPNPKRPCYDFSYSIQNPNPNSPPIAPDLNQSDFDSVISSFLSLPESPSTSIGCSFDRALGQAISSASGDDFVDRACKLASLFHESTKRLYRSRAALYNSNSWPLPSELTTKVFCMLDTMSRRKASACCTMFRKCYMDPLCYSHIDLSKTTKPLNEKIVCTMIHRAGKELRSLKLGLITGQVIPSLTSSCLTWDLLRSLHINCFQKTTTNSLCDLLSACPNLTDLKIINFEKARFLKEVLKSLTGSHRLLEHLFLENHIRWRGISSSAVEDFATSCPNLTSLTLINSELKEETARTLAVAFPKLNYMDLSKTDGINGRFLRDLGNSGRDKSPLKTLILRECRILNSDEIAEFLKSVITTDYYRFIRHIDVSRKLGKIFIPKTLLKMLKEERPNVTFVA